MEYLEGAGDARLKPRLLRSILRDRLREKDDGDSDGDGALADLSRLLDLLKHHSPLSDPPQDSSKKLADTWRAAVDAWVDRVLSLSSSDVLYRCWAGTSLLGVTCAECSEDRFLKSYSAWFQKLLSNFQPLPDYHFLRVALCSSLSDLFTRLAEFPTIKKDATSLSLKVVQLLLQLLSEDSSDAVWAQAVDLLHVLVNFYPSSVHRHIDRVEAVLVSKIMSAKYSENVSQKLAACLALLPRSKGDEASLSLMFKKILVAINAHLDDAFQGLEEGIVSLDIKKLLIPPREETLPPLGGYVTTEESSKNTIRWLQEILVPRVSTLTQCCALMVTDPYPVQVTVPIRILLKLVRRVLSVDGSLQKSMLPSTTSLHQECLCSVLPNLHLRCLDLLSAIIRGLRSQLLPHSASIAQILADYFDKASVLSTRIKLYQVVQQLLTSSGAGMALYLSQDVIKNAFIVLNSSSYGITESSKNDLEVEFEYGLPNTPRKRKHTNESPTCTQNGADIEVKATQRKQIAPESLQIAALGALEALITVGGSLKSEFWRSDADLLLMRVAANACDAAQNKRTFHVTENSTMGGAHFPLAALRALLASLLSPTNVRPPYLSEGLEIFRKGKLGADPNISAFCSHSLLALEVLIHPRALPLSHPSDYSPNYEASLNSHYMDNKFPNFPRFSVPPVTKQSANKVDEINIDNDDDLYNWQNDRKETEMGVGNQDRQLKIAEEPNGVSPDHQDHIQTEPMAVVSTYDIHEIREATLDQNADVEMVSRNLDDAIKPSKDEPSLQDNAPATKGTDTPMVLSEAGGSIPVDPLKFGDPVDNSKRNLVFPEVASHYDSDESSSLGSIPPIVDVEPDSDSSLSA